MTSKPPTEFGKRKPTVPPAASPPVKRSRHVALLLTGTLAVGGAAYALTPRGSCEPNVPGTAAPSSPGATACTPRGSSSSWGHSGGSWSRNNFFSGESSSPSSSSSTTQSGSGETARGGFGGFAHAFAAHFSGGG